MRLLVVCSSLDLRAPLGCTPSWWQLLIALAQQGVDLTVTPFHGPAIESPWWTAASNPCQREGDAVALAKRAFHWKDGASAQSEGESRADRLVRWLAAATIRPRWKRHLSRLLEQRGQIDAVLFMGVPPNQFNGIPAHLLRRFGVPSYLYDGDVPASLPAFAGFQSGFKIYPGADLSEFEGLLSNSRGGVNELLRMGARNVQVLHYAADPLLFSPVPTPQDIDVFFYGHGVEYREQWIDAMLIGPSKHLSDVRFSVRGTRLGNLGRIEMLPYLSFSRLREYCCRSKINLLITRRAHASVYASSTARLFELAALGCAMVSNPYLGVEEWFEPGREVLVAQTEAEATDTYRLLLRDDVSRSELGQRARERFLAEHTYQHRAIQLVEYLKGKKGVRSDTLGALASPNGGP